MSKRQVKIGLMVEPLREQLPELDVKVADLLTDDMTAIGRLSARGYIHQATRDGMYKKLLKRIDDEMKFALAVEKKVKVPYGKS
jgi:hypothetical protein